VETKDNSGMLPLIIVSFVVLIVVIAVGVAAAFVILKHQKNK
jgi:flagellar basal body-associated protein FliL